MTESNRVVSDERWPERLQMLCERFSYLGIGADLAGLSMIELWGLYLFLLRLYEMQGGNL